MFPASGADLLFNPNQLLGVHLPDRRELFGLVVVLSGEWALGNQDPLPRPWSQNE